MMNGDDMSVDAKTNEVLWVEKYRPQKIEDTILSPKLSKASKNLYKTIVYQTYCYLVAQVLAKLL